MSNPQDDSLDGLDKFLVALEQVHQDVHRIYRFLEVPPPCEPPVKEYDPNQQAEDRATSTLLQYSCYVCGELFERSQLRWEDGRLYCFACYDAPDEGGSG